MALSTTMDGPRMMPMPISMPSLGNSNTEPIDLTLTDNEDELPRPEPKRARVNGQSAAYIPHSTTPNDHLLAPRHPTGFGVPAISPLSQPLNAQGPWVSQVASQPYQSRSWVSQPTPGQLQQQYNALSRAHAMASPFGRMPHVTPTPPPPSFNHTSAVTSNFIDLTRESPHPSPSPAPQQPPFFLNQTMVLSDDLSPTTAILIGQINVQALVLNPIPYIAQQTHNVFPSGQQQDYVPVKLRLASHNPDSQDILVFSPASLRNGNPVAPDNFAVVEKKVAARLQPLISKRAIKLEAMIKTVQSGSNILVASLVVLVFTAKGNVSQIAEALMKYGLLLERPGLMWKGILTNNDLIYHNPHEGHAPVPVAPSANTSRWASPAVSSKSVEIQRTAADAVFQTLRGEEDLPETSPGISISTPLYPHQKKALSFLLEREQELQVASSGKTASLWQCNGSGWKNSVTQEIVYSKPKECKGALLADDMGLGKTIETLCLLAYTLDKAREFALQPLEPVVAPEPIEEPSMHQFIGAVFDMPDVKKLTVSKEKKKAQHEKEIVEYNRLTRIKQKSRATLIVCPLSTIVSWEDQIRDHWGGEVTVVGGVGTVPATSTTTAAAAPPPTLNVVSEFSSDAMLTDGRMSETPSLRLMSEAPSSIRSAQPSRQTTPNPVHKRGQPIRVYVYHGASRRPDAQFLSTFDIVITTYSTLSSEYSKQMRGNGGPDDDEDGISSDSGIMETDEAGNPLVKKKGKAKRKKPFIPGDSCSPLQAIHWFRVVLDEAHFIKEPSTVASRACCDLIADRRLCLTGTPLQNKVDDVYALIKFIRLKPFDDKTTWSQLIGTPIKYNQPIGFTRLQTIMRLIALRRTKDTKDQNGKPILSLPSRTDKMVLLKLHNEERTVYDSFFGESQAEFMNMAKADVMKNYVNILQKILRLRQICDDVELIKASRDGQRYDCAAQYEEALAGIEKDGINLERATAIFALLRETSTSQCAECGYELASLPSEGGPDAPMDGDDTQVNAKRGRKNKQLTNTGGSGSGSGSGTRACSPCPTVHPIITRCTHLYCLCCFRNKVCASWPCVPAETRAQCSVCQLEIIPTVDAIEVRSDGTDMKEPKKKEPTKKVKRIRGEPIVNYKPSTKVLALLQELLPFSKRNPYSANYDYSLVDADEIQEVDESGRRVDSDIVKSVVFSQWTTMLDKIEDALEMANICYERLDGTMKREERNKALDGLKNNPKCEVLLVSLKAGGVGLTLTAARRVYIMDPYWNPAVENQAIDRIHRLGQVNPVVSTKFIIENSIEQRLLEVQQKKADLAKMTLGKPLSKQDLQQRRLEELQNLLGANDFDD